MWCTTNLPNRAQQTMAIAGPRGCIAARNNHGSQAGEQACARAHGIWQQKHVARHECRRALERRGQPLCPAEEPREARLCGRESQQQMMRVNSIGCQCWFPRRQSLLRASSSLPARTSTCGLRLRMQSRGCRIAVLNGCDNAVARDLGREVGKTAVLTRRVAQTGIPPGAVRRATGSTSNAIHNRTRPTPMNALDYSRNAMAPSCFAYATIRKFFAMV
jgi:hypothetical protein